MKRALAAGVVAWALSGCGGGQGSPGVPAAPAAPAALLSVAGMRADMTGPHESTVVGVSPEWSWGRAADLGDGLNAYPASWTSPAYAAWGLLAPPDGVDDLDRARLDAVAAGDIYQSMDAPWNAANPVHGHAPIGRFRQIGREWRTVTTHLGLNTDLAFSEYIRWAATQP